jgi:uncharacterized membrane protein
MSRGEAEPVYEVRRISSADIRESLAQGWDDFLDRRGDLLFLGLVYPLVGLLAATLALGGALIPLLFPVAAGISLLGPVAAAGFYELARCRESGKECDWSHYFDVHRRPGWDGIVTVASILLVIFLAWILAAAALYVALFGSEPYSLGQFVTRLFTTSEGWTLIIAGNLVGAFFAGLVLMLSVVSMPMLVDKDIDARTAIATSVRAVLANKAMMVRWGLIVAALLIVGTIPLFIGLAVVLPVLGYATWHLYTHMVVR